MTCKKKLCFKTSLYFLNATFWNMQNQNVPQIKSEYSQKSEKTVGADAKGVQMSGNWYLGQIWIFLTLQCSVASSPAVNGSVFMQSFRHFLYKYLINYCYITPQFDSEVGILLQDKSLI